MLLNDEHDPFNRAPLKLEQVIELPELKRKIENWIKGKLAEYDRKHGLGIHKKEKVIDEDGDSKMEEEKMEVEEEAVDNFGIPKNNLNFK